MQFDTTDIAFRLQEAAALGREPAFLFDRVSHIRQKDGISLEYQLENGNYYVDRNQLHIVCTFMIIESAYKENRKYFNTALDLAEKYNVKNLVFKNPDRLSRNILHLNRITSMIENGGFVFHFYETGQKIFRDCHYDDKVMFYQFIVWNQRHSMKLSYDMKRVYQYKASKGIPFFRPPVGYIYSLETKSPAIDPEREQDLRFIFNEFDTFQYSLDDFAALLNAKGITATGGNPWTKGNIHRLLRNPFYHGEFNLKGIQYHGTYPIYYDRTRYNRRMEYMSIRYVGKAKYNRSYSMAGLLRCGICGRILTGDTKKDKYIYYVHKCTGAGSNYKEAYLHDMIDAAIVGVAFTADFAEMLKSLFANAIEEKNKYQESDVVRIAREISHLEKEQDKLVRLYRKSSIDAKVLERNINDINKQIEVLEKQRSLMRVDKNGFITHVAGVIDNLQDLPEIYEYSSRKDRVKLICSMADRVIVYSASVEIIWKQPFSFILQKKILQMSAVSPRFENRLSVLPRQDSNLRPSG